MRLDYDNGIEQAVLGYAMIDGDKSFLLKLSSDDFYNEFNKTLFNHILTIFKDKKSVDMMDVSALNLYEFERLIDICDISIGVPSVEKCVKSLKDLTNERKLKIIAYEISQGKIDLMQAKEQISLLESENLDVDVDNSKDILDAYEELSTFNREEYQAKGIKTGFKKIDEKLLINPCDFIVLGATQSTGKTAFILNVVKNNPGKVIAYYSNDATKKSLWKRLLGIKAFKNVQNIDDFLPVANAAKYFENQPLYIDDKCRTVTDIFQSVKEIKKKHGHVDLIIVDYLQRVSSTGHGRYEKITSAAEGIDDIAKYFECPVIAISALTTDKTGRKPTENDLRGSGDIQYYVKSVWLLYSEYKETGEGDEGKVTFICAKQKEGGAFESNLCFIKERLTFSEYELIKKE